MIEGLKVKRCTVKIGTNAENQTRIIHRNINEIRVEEGVIVLMKDGYVRGMYPSQSHYIQVEEV